MSWRETIKKGEPEAKAKGWRATIKASEPEVSKLESAARGAAQGASLGFADEITGGLEAGKDVLTDDAVKLKDLLERYRKRRDESRANYRKAEEANPKSYLAGNVGGGLATMAVPGLNVAKGASLGKAALQSAGLGAVGGFGSSEREDVAGLAKDTVIGAGIGGAMPFAAKAAAPVVEKGVKVLKAGGTIAGTKVARTVTQLPEETIERYAKRNAQVRAARPLEEVAREVESSVGQLGRRVSEGSGESFGILAGEGAQVPRKNVVDAIMGRVNMLRERGVYSPDVERELQAMQSFAERVAGEGAEESMMAGGRAKALIQQIDENLGVLQKKSGDVPTQVQRQMAGARGDIDGMLKDVSPAYKEKMAAVARDAELLSRVNPRMGNKENALNTLKGIARDRTPFQSESLADLDATLGKGLGEEARDSMVKDAFAKSSANGSRNVNFFGRSIPVIGDMLGYAVDTYGRPGTAKAIDWAVQSREFLQASGIPDKFRTVLENAASRGPAALIATHQTLMRTNEEYRRANESSAP